MIATTTRLDRATWAEVKRQAELLDISHAEFIRGAVHQRLGRLAEIDRLAALEADVATVRGRVDRIAQVVIRTVGSRRRT